MVRRDWTAAREKVEAEGQCRACLASGILDAAHIVPRSLGGGQSADSVVPLCRDCHNAYDRYLLDLIPVLTRDEQVEAVRVLGLQRAHDRLSGRRALSRQEAA